MTRRTAFSHHFLVSASIDRLKKIGYGRNYIRRRSLTTFEYRLLEKFGASD